MWHKLLVRFFLALFLIQMLLPIVGLVMFSTQDGKGHATLAVYTRLFSDQGFQQALERSAVISLLTVVLSIVLLTPPIWYAYMHHPRVLRVLTGISYLPFVLPAVVLGLGYVQFFSNPPLALAGTPTLLPFAFTLLAMPFYLQAVLNRLQFMDAKTFQEASESLGGSLWQSWVRVHLPLLRPGIINGSALVFSMSMGEFAITQLTTGGSFISLPIALQVAFGNDPVGGSAMAVVVFAIAALAVFAVLAGGSLTKVRPAKQTPASTGDGNMPLNESRKGA